jgi:pimeloyl-ACP methyl ester carboxylesterase
MEEVMSEAVERFRIQVSDAVLEDLRARLARARFPDQLEDAGWSYGSELSYLRELVAYWRDKYDWRAHEAALNRFDHWKTQIDGLGVHFIHARSKEPNAFPLVLSHGWPGSIVEFTKILPMLTDPVAHGGRAEDAFHVVCPSLPGYGFSDRPRRPGFDVREIAAKFAALMARLGYAGYGAQGGDWGAFVTTWLALLDPEHCKGIHLNMVVALPSPDAGALSPEEQADVADFQKFQADETGYQAIQGTKPQTLGYGLNDSPVGLAAWIVEKFRTWSDCGGDVERRFTKDELLTNVMIYWVTETITSSTRLYCENRRSGRLGMTDPVSLPTGCAVFPKELYRSPRAWAEKRFKDIRRWTRMPSGGHFAAMEEPRALAEEIRAFFREVR